MKDRHRVIREWVPDRQLQKTAQARQSPNERRSSVFLACLSGYQIRWRLEPIIPFGQYAQGAPVKEGSAAWGWLIAQGLLVPSVESSVQGSYQLSRRALAFENLTDFARFAVARTLQKEALHSRIADSVWFAFMRGEFDGAVFQAMKAIEVSVREASGLSDGLFGTALMRSAFYPKTGPLTDRAAEIGERQACSALFAGAIGMYKNPQSHRDVNSDNPGEAAEIIMMANNLLRIVDARRDMNK